MDSCKIVVFDLDETLGYFVEFGMFWHGLKSYVSTNHKTIELTKVFDNSFFIQLLDLFSEFLRPNILEVLNFVKQRKKQRHCNKVLIYTNNQGPPEWTPFITNYFETKLNYKLFDQIISAFKINGKRVEICRTSHSKNHHDFIRCSKMPLNTQICFLDDTMYPDMSNENVYYVHIEPYVHWIQPQQMLDRLIGSQLLQHFILDEKDFRTHVVNFMARYNHIKPPKTSESYRIDTILTKRILEHLHIFFRKHLVVYNRRGTRKIKRKSKNKSLKAKSN